MWERDVYFEIVFCIDLLMVWLLMCNFVIKLGKILELFFFFVWIEEIFDIFSVCVDV